MKDTLHYFKQAATSISGKPITVQLITNFTDATLQKLFAGVLKEEGIEPTITASAYKQYHLHLKNPSVPCDITFMLFDVNNYVHSAFHTTSHFEEMLQDIERYAQIQQGPVIVSLFPIPYVSAYGNLSKESELYDTVTKANEKLEGFAKTIANLYTFDTNRMFHQFGEKTARNFRELYSADLPFTNDFLLALSQEWAALIRVHLGLIKKCLVLDMDNTLWGGILGEVGPLGITLGPDYPGLAYQNFQQALVNLYNRGIILALNSRNNEKDVEEVFTQNKHMILKPKHFAAMRINWNDKVQNLRELAEELNMGLDAMVFIDDDPMNRDVVRTMLPEVAVPDWSLPPEEYTPSLLSLTYFHQFSLTQEDREKGKMYAQERQRKVVAEQTQSLEEYIAALNIVVSMHLNDETLIPRIAQMTHKTNQFNLTTKRYGEKEISEYMKKGWVCAADVSDRFGDYGTTVLAIVLPTGKNAAHLDTFLMSCRVMGRGVEEEVMKNVLEALRKDHVRRLTAEFIPTAKNEPAKDFLDRAGFTKDDGAYYIDTA